MCGDDADCDHREGEDPPIELCPPAIVGVHTTCDNDSDGKIDEDPSCIPMFNGAGSGQVDAIDSALILQMSAGLLASLPCGPAADANADGQVNAIDATLILQFVAGLLSSLPP